MLPFGGTEVVVTAYSTSAYVLTSLRVYEHKINVFVSVLGLGWQFEHKISVFVSVWGLGWQFERKINVFVSVLGHGWQFEHKINVFVLMQYQCSEHNTKK